MLLAFACGVIFYTEFVFRVCIDAKATSRIFGIFTVFFRGLRKIAENLVFVIGGRFLASQSQKPPFG